MCAQVPLDAQDVEEGMIAAGGRGLRAVHGQEGGDARARDLARQLGRPQRRHHPVACR